ncbi:MAG TPA: hypothetical protein VFR79_08185 [Nitrospira sp.]|nr:hypothetical protein [Nitrospira sp.]
MSFHWIIGLHVLVAAVTWLVVTVQAAEPNGRLEITGDYRYKVHASEASADAKDLACREALRQAVVNSAVYREHTAAIVDSALLRDVANTLSTGHVQDQEIVEQSEDGRVVFCRVKAFLPAEESVRAIRTQLAGGPESADGLDQNRVLRLLSVKEDRPGMLAIQYQTLKRMDWVTTHYQGGLRDAAHIMIDFYDAQGLLLYSQRFEAWRTPTGEDIMSPGAVGILQVPKPASAKSYRVWLVK